MNEWTNDGPLVSGGASLDQIRASREPRIIENHSKNLILCRIDHRRLADSATPSLGAHRVRRGVKDGLRVTNSYGHGIQEPAICRHTLPQILHKPFLYAQPKMRQPSCTRANRRPRLTMTILCIVLGYIASALLALPGRIRGEPLALGCHSARADSPSPHTDESIFSNFSFLPRFERVGRSELAQFL